MKIITALAFILCLAIGVPSIYGTTQSDHGSERVLRHDSDPVQDDVTSPPVPKYTGKPSYSPTGEPTRSPSRIPTPLPSLSPSSTPTKMPSSLPSIDTSIPPSILPSSSQPSSIPTARPSSSPSNQPSNAPTTIPTLSPSSLPSPLPTVVPTVFPSESPSLLPTGYPTVIPSTSPSSFPTVVHSMAPTASESPSIALSYIPSTSISPTEVKECSPNNDGLFGSEGDFELAIEFAYELETHTSIPSDVLPPLENVFSAAILPSLFSERCSNRLAPSTRRRRLAAIGVSARPEDVVLDSVACGKKKSNNNNCAVVQGELTLFLSEDKSNEMMNQAIIQILKDGMTNDEFVHAHPDIERVTFVMLSAIPKSSATVSEDSPTPAPSNRDGLGVLWGVIATVVGLLFLLAAFVWRRKQKEAEDEEDSEANEGSLDPEAGNPNIGGDLLG